MPRGAVGKQRGRGGPPGALSRHDACSSSDPITRAEERLAGTAPTFALTGPRHAEPVPFSCFLDAKDALDEPAVPPGSYVQCVKCGAKLATRGVSTSGEGTNGDALARRIFYKQSENESEADADEHS